MDKINSLSIVFPVYNEEANIRAVIEDTLVFLQEIARKYEVIAVNDGSTDGTAGILNELATTHQALRIIHFPENRGYGTALRTGFEHARSNFVFFTDSDRQFDITSLRAMLPLIQSDDVDAVIGYRMNRQDSFVRKFLSWGFNTLAGFMFDLNVKDIDCAFKLFKAKIFKKITIESERFFIDTEILAKARYFGFNIIEIGVKHFPRTAGKSSVSFKHIPLTVIELMRIRRSIQKLRNTNE